MKIMSVLHDECISRLETPMNMITDPLLSALQTATKSDQRTNRGDESTRGSGREEHAQEKNGMSSESRNQKNRRIERRKTPSNVRQYSLHIAYSSASNIVPRFCTT